MHATCNSQNCSGSCVRFPLNEFFWFCILDLCKKIIFASVMADMFFQVQLGHRVIVFCCTSTRIVQPAHDSENKCLQLDTVLLPVPRNIPLYCRHVDGR